MRHIDLATKLPEIFADVDGAALKERLVRAKRKLGRGGLVDPIKYTRKNGPNKWSPIKDKLTQTLGNKCWYTEVEVTGMPLHVDHFRPIFHYLWLAYEPENYRVSCHFANSSTFNPTQGCVGGKCEEFPLLQPRLRANDSAGLVNELPVILDPCIASDCKLVAFRSDGLPIVNPAFEHDQVSVSRVEQSKILLNLDHPDFNSKREQLCNNITADVNAFEELPLNSPSREVIRSRLKQRLSSKAPFSSAARYYLCLHREFDWVDSLLQEPAI